MHAGQFGDEALCKQGKIVGYYRTVAASYGLQASIPSIHPSIHSFCYALFFIQEKALEYLNKSKGWEIGVGPSLVEVHAGFAGALTPITAKEDLCAFFFLSGGTHGRHRALVGQNYADHSVVWWGTINFMRRGGRMTSPPCHGLIYRRFFHTRIYDLSLHPRKFF